MPLGIGLILVALVDVHLTVLHVQAESPVSNKLGRVFWQSLLGLTRGLPKRTRDEILAWGMPLMIVGTITFWGVLYVVGFGLLYLPVVHDPSIFSVEDGAMTSALGDALYFSAVSFFTLGYGDVVAVHPLARLLGVLQGAAGLLTISLSVTYLLSIYPLITRKMTLAASLNQETDGRADGVAVAGRYVTTGRFDVLAQRLRELNDELLYLGQSHGFYPVLYYVRPREVHLSFVRLLALVQGIVATLRYGLDRTVHQDVVTDPRLVILEEGLIYTLHALGSSIHMEPGDEEAEDTDAACEEFAALLAELADSGVALATLDDRAAVEGHSRFRASTDPYIRAYAQNLGYDRGSVRANYGRRQRDSAPVRPPDPQQERTPS